ncbi:hypothetical protein GJV07_22825 [Enterobacteriaceae bacterium RIT711]|nr:hypothetical protein [Enterobacteriaceae bacterium RIT711]
MSQMIFRPGNAEKWKGVGYDFKIVGHEEVEGYLEDGWFAHPDDLLNDAEDTEPEPEKKSRKKKAVTDEPHD